MTNFEPMTANYYFPAADGTERGYHVRAVEVAPDLFNVYVTRVRDGLRANGAFGRVVDAEDWIVQDRVREAARS